MMKSFFCIILVFVSVVYGSIRRVNEIHAKKGLPDHQILGVAQTASKSELKQAYFSLSKELHPDKIKQGFTPRQLNRPDWCEHALNAGSEAFKIMSSAYERMVAKIEQQEAQDRAREEFLREEAARMRREQELQRKRLEEQRLRREREQRLREEQERRERDLRAFRMARQAEFERENRRLHEERMRKAAENRAAEQRKAEKAEKKRQEAAEAEWRRIREESRLAFAEENVKSMLRQHEKDKARLEAAAEAQRKEEFEARLASDPEFRARHEAKLAEEEAKRAAEAKYQAYSEDLIRRQNTMIRSCQRTKAILRRAWLRDVRAQGIVPEINQTPRTPDVTHEHVPIPSLKRKRYESSDDEDDESVYEWNMPYRVYAEMRSARKRARREPCLDEFF